MKLKNYKINFSIVIAIFIIAIAITAHAWQNPTANPPDGNLSAPLNASSNAQSKSGNLYIGGSLSVGTTNAPSGNLQVLGSSNNTIYIGNSSHSGCIVMGDTNNGAVTYLTVLSGVLTATTTKPSTCQ